ncbi:hypothetical protein HYZ80_01880 [Candidatus Parcubacteria bacterium]|nr:hypothetical protein [Candidatus Parcubacteria bacterium]
MKISTSTKTGLVIGVIGASIISLLIIFSIFRSTSSTAAIGFVFIPVYFAIAFIGFSILGYCVGYVKAWLGSVPRIFNFKVGLAFIVSICLAIFVIGGLGKGLLLTSITSQIRGMNTNQELLNTFDNSFFNRDKFVLGAIAQNLAASPELLDSIAKLNDLSLQNAIGSLFPLLGDNRKGLAVMRLVVKNPNVSANTIEYLANTNQTDYVLGDIAGNSKTSIETLRRLELKKNYLIDWGLAQNQKTPSDVFSKLLEREKYFTQRTTLEMLLRNPSTSPEIRTRASELLKEY